MRRAAGQRTASLMQIAAAIVGAMGAVGVIRAQCRDPHCARFGTPDFGACPAEHAEAWRYDFRNSGNRAVDGPSVNAGASSGPDVGVGEGGAEKAPLWPAGGTPDDES